MVWAELDLATTTFIMKKDYFHYISIYQIYISIYQIYISLKKAHPKAETLEHEKAQHITLDRIVVVIIFHHITKHILCLNLSAGG